MSKLFAPIPITVTVSTQALPRSFVWRGRRRWVQRVCNQWRVESGWWSQPVVRDYYKLLAADGLICVIYLDHTDERWYLERILD